MTPDALDITVAVILLLSTLIAYFRGLIREVFTIVALIMATGSAYFGGPLLVQPFQKWFHADTPEAQRAGREAAEAVIRATQNGTDAGIAKSQLFMGIIPYEHVAQICAFGSAFLFIYFVMSLIGFFITRFIAESGLGIVDKILGAGFGLVRGGLLVFLAYLPVSYYYEGTHKEMEPWAKNSVSVKVLNEAVAYVDQHVNLTNVIHEAGDAVAKKIKKHEEQHASQDAAAPVKDGNAQPPAPEDQKAHDEKELEDELSNEEKKTPQ